MGIRCAHSLRIEPIESARRTVAVLLALLLPAGCTTKEVQSKPSNARPVQVWQDGQSASSADLALLATPATRPSTEPSTQPTTEPSSALPEPRLFDEGRKSTLIYPCRYARPETLAEAISGLITPEGNVLASAALNRLVVVDDRDTVRQVQHVLDEIDYPTDQLLVEARIVEVTLDSDLEFEIQHILNIPAGDNAFLQSSNITFKTPGGSPSDGQGANIDIRSYSSNGKTLDSLIRLLVTRSKAKILSSPNLIVSPGNEASIITGQEVPVQSATVVSGSVSTTTLFKRVGIKLRVALQQITDDTARVDISPEVSTITGFTNPSAEGVSNPIIAIRNVSSALALKDGEILTVGGLLQTEDRQIIRGIPFLSDIPIVGLLFQSRRNEQVRTQLIFFLRVHILHNGNVGQERLHRPGVGMEHVDRKMGLELPPGNGAYPVSPQDAANIKSSK
jgi:type II secretory pathway component GspD/PulD (secretin)